MNTTIMYIVLKEGNMIFFIYIVLQWEWNNLPNIDEVHFVSCLTRSEGSELAAGNAPPSV